ncbi:MAG: hypothetical protein LBN07_00425 [Christensenellaceae bacterium]|jgi:hypothetical protein|nr:hypothetical protein [Christensenellaceae bacterium]
MKDSCENLTTMEQFINCWKTCSLSELQEIAEQYSVAFEKNDDKDILIEKLAEEMKKCC